MSKLRLIARLDIKGPKLIKGIHLEGLRVIGDPNEYARHYYSDGIDELLYIDAVASLYGRNSLHDIVRHTAGNIFVPITVGGGIRSIEDAREILRAGADKIAINTAAVKTPSLISDLARTFGSQCVVLSIAAKKQAPNRWEAYTDCGREKTGLDVIDWAKRGVELGAGELLLTSVDQEGTKAGFDIELVETVSAAIDIPVVVSGGMGKVEDIAKLSGREHVSGIAMASVLHYKKLTVQEIRQFCIDVGLDVRRLSNA